jgi:hypothetical protein
MEYVSKFTCYEVLTHSLTHGAEAFLRSCQLCNYSRNTQYFMEPEGSLPCSQDQTSSIKHQENIHNFFLNCDGILHHEFMWPSYTLNKQYYANVLQHVQENIVSNAKWRSIGWFIMTICPLKSPYL